MNKNYTDLNLFAPRVESVVISLKEIGEQKWEKEAQKLSSTNIHENSLHWILLVSTVIDLTSIESLPLLNKVAQDILCMFGTF